MTLYGEVETEEYITLKEMADGACMAPYLLYR